MPTDTLKAPLLDGVVRPNNIPLKDTSTFKKPTAVPVIAMVPATADSAAGAVTRSCGLATATLWTMPFTELVTAVTVEGALAGEAAVWLAICEPEQPARQTATDSMTPHHSRDRCDIVVNMCTSTLQTDDKPAGGISDRHLTYCWSKPRDPGSSQVFLLGDSRVMFDKYES